MALAASMDSNYRSRTDLQGCGFGGKKPIEMTLCIIIQIITAHPGRIRHSDNMVIGSFFHADAVDEGNSFMTIKMGDKVRCSFCNKTRALLF